MIPQRTVIGEEHNILLNGLAVFKSVLSLGLMGFFRLCWSLLDVAAMTSSRTQAVGGSYLSSIQC